MPKKLKEAVYIVQPLFIFIIETTYFATATALVSRITVILTCPG